LEFSWAIYLFLSTTLCSYDGIGYFVISDDYIIPVGSFDF